MPFTPYHFGPSAIIGLPLKRYIDIPVFVLANVVVDLEPLASMKHWLDIPLHGLLHTFLIGGLVGLLWGVLAYPLRPVFRPIIQSFYLPYQTGIFKMAVSGVLGVWLHVLIDSVLYKEMNPFWRIAGNPLHKIVPYSTIYTVCEVMLIAAAVIYPAWALYAYRRTKSTPRT